MKSNLKWLLLIPVFAVAITLGYLIPTQLLSGGSDEENTATNKQQSQAVQIELADVQEKLSNYQQVLNRNPNDTEVLRILGDTYYEQGTIQGENGEVNNSYRSHKNAVDQYRKYLALKPNDLDVTTDLGLTYAELQMTDIAIRELNAAITVAPNDPNNQRAWHALGWVQYKWASNITDAKVAWQKSYELNPNTPIGQESKSFLDQFAGQEGLVLPGSAP